MFAEIEDFYIRPLKAQIDALRKSKRGISLNDLVPVITQRDSVVDLDRPCIAHRHARQTCMMKAAGVSVAGIPCVSFAGLGRCDGLKGDCMVAWAAYFALKRHLQEPVLIIECNKRLTTQPLEAMIGDLYVITRAAICPTDIGWVARRPRAWFLCIHKRSMADGPLCSLENVLPIFRRSCSVTWSVCFDATPSELEAELEWAASRRCSMAHGKALVEIMLCRSPFMAALSKKDSEYLQTYQELKRSCSYNLGQNPLKKSHMGSSSKFHTLIHSSGIQWSDQHDRQATAREEMQLLGIDPSRGTSSFAPGRRTSSRSRASVHAALGDGMNVPVASAVWLVAMLLYMPADLQADDSLISGLRSLAELSDLGTFSGATATAMDSSDSD